MIRILTIALLCATTTGCVGIGFASGAIVDNTMKAVAYPIHEYAALGAYKYDNDPDLPWRAFPEEDRHDFGQELIGVAVSGGGSRSAYFLACALDEMRKIPWPGGTATAKRGGRSLLDEVDFISSVSGGSLSSAYYVHKRPRTYDPAALDAFFEQYREDMRLHFEARALGRMFLGFRWIPLLATYYNRAHLIAGVWDSNFFDDATFADLPPPGGPIPSLVINTASYSTGNKFLFTRVPIARFNGSQLFRRLKSAHLIRGGAASEHTPFLASSMETLENDIGAFKLSYAVAASASVPGLLGPTNLRDPEGRYETLGDGGLYDNYGLETMIQLFATLLEYREGARARIIVVDGSGFFPSNFDHRRLGPLAYMDRTNSIAWLRSGGFAEAIYQLMPAWMPPDQRGPEGDAFDRKRSPYRNLRVQVVSLYHEGGAQEVPDRFRALDLLTGRALARAVTAFNSEVRGIGTRFKISDDDAELVEFQARRAVVETLGAGAPRPGGTSVPKKLTEAVK